MKLRLQNPEVDHDPDTSPNLPIRMNLGVRYSATRGGIAFESSGDERFSSRGRSIDSENHRTESLGRMPGREKSSILSRTVGRRRDALVTVMHVDGTNSIRPVRMLVRIITRKSMA